MRSQKFSVVLVILSLFILSSTATMATDGYFRHGYGVKYSAMGGAGVAVSLSSLGAISNPAGIVAIDSRIDINLALFSPSRDFTISGNPSGYPGTFGLTPGNTESDSKSFIMPTIGGSYKINPAMAIGLAFYGNGGMNTNYPKAVFYDPSSPNTGINLEQMFAAATFAYEFSKDQAIGVSAIFGWQRFAAKGVLSFGGFSSDPASLSGNSFSTSTGFGGKIGYQGTFANMFKIGASYETKIAMGKFDRYKGLFAEEGGFDVPASWTVGVGFLPNPEWTLLLDFQQINYSGIRSINNSFLPNIRAALLGESGGAGFGWKDMSVVKFGAMYKVNAAWTLMAGYSYGTQPVPSSEVLFNILAPGIVQHHITCGFTKAMGNHNELNLALMYAPAVTVSGANPLEAPGQQTIDIRMSQLQVEVGYSFSSL